MFELPTAETAIPPPATYALFETNVELTTSVTRLPPRERIARAPPRPSGNTKPIFGATFPTKTSFTTFTWPAPSIAIAPPRTALFLMNVDSVQVASRLPPKSL